MANCPGAGKHPAVEMRRHGSLVRAEQPRARREAATLTERRDRIHRPKRHEHGVRVLFSTSDGYDAGGWAPFALPEHARTFFAAEVAKLEARDSDAWTRSMGPVQFELIEFGAITRITSFMPPS